MLGLCKTVLLLYILGIFVECSHPGSLSVRKLNRQLIARKRQNTLDLCQTFNVENEKEQYKLLKHNRVRRSADAPPKKPVDKIEKIVDKLYDEAHVSEEKVEYRKKNQTNTTKTEKPARRFDFAPSILDVNITPPDEKPDDTKDDARTVTVDWHKYWKHGIIPYFIDSNTYDTYLSEKITKAFDDFEQSTCIRLQRLREKPTDKKSLQDATWLYISNPSGTRQCVHSNEHKPNIGVQWVVFGYDCMSEGQIMHEIMHILGFSHEHVREDRDQHVSILWDNIKPGYKRFFEIKPRPPILVGLPYDHASVLHYPPRAFSKNGKFTLMASPGVQFGQREGLSDIDVEKVSMVYSGECIARNKQYLVTTCPTVIASTTQKKTQKATQQEIDEYFNHKLWPYGIVNYKIKDKIEFSIEERQNIEEVIKHIEKETCIEFRDFSNDDDNVETTTVNDDEVVADDGNKIVISGNDIDVKDEEPNNSPDTNTISDSDKNKISDDDIDYKEPYKFGNSSKIPSRRPRRAIPPSPARRHADDLLVLTRSPDPGCRCPESGRASAQKELVITSDCFNSVNDLLHVFVHVLGLDHQHNMHDRDDYLAINWSNVTASLKKDLQKKLPPAASVGFAYDYQSVMHYPWLVIKNGVTNIMYPIWNDGWAMGHWQGLSSVDVQKLNLLYFAQCQSRKKHIAKTLRKQ